jgi:hypothetical protein
MEAKTVATAWQVAAAKPGVHRVSGAVGLYLKKTGITAGPYFFRYRFKGGRRAVGLGSIGDVSLAGARLRAQEFKVERGRGHDRIEARRQQKAENLVKALFRQRVKPDPIPTPGLTHLYRHYDIEGRLLYVGVAPPTNKRLQPHRQQAAWLHLTTIITVDDYPTRAWAEAAEARAILEERPIYNHVVRVDLVGCPPD